jgi:hypothetical protein
MGIHPRHGSRVRNSLNDPAVAITIILSYLTGTVGHTERYMGMTDPTKGLYPIDINFSKE